MTGMRADLEPMGESAYLLRIGDRIDLRVNVRVHAVCRALRAAEIEGLRDLVPAYASILLRFDPPCCGRGTELRERILDLADRILGASETPAGDEAPLHRIPVCYGGEHGPDMNEVERRTGLSGARIAELHCRPEYRVAMIGFAPGFAYLLGLDEKLRIPRREHPRTRVPRGSVALGGAQTGIYPDELPGGWQLIGRTPLVMFDARDEQNPCRLAPGDRVRFEAIDADAYERLRKEAKA